jgi:hypothetical protein
MSNQSIPGKLTQAQYWQAHASAQQLAAEGSGFEAALAAVFFKADLHNAAALVNAFPYLFTIAAPEAQEDPDHWQIDEDLPSSHNLAGSDRNDQQ